MLDTREFRQTRVWFISTFSPSRRAIILQLNAVSNNNTSILVLLYRERLTIPNHMMPETHCSKPANRLSGSSSIVLCIVHMSPIQVTVGPDWGLGSGYIIHALLNDRNTNTALEDRSSYRIFILQLVLTSTLLAIKRRNV